MNSHGRSLPPRATLAGQILSCPALVKIQLNRFLGPLSFPSSPPSLPQFLSPQTPTCARECVCACVSVRRCECVCTWGFCCCLLLLFVVVDFLFLFWGSWYLCVYVGVHVRVLCVCVSILCVFCPCCLARSHGLNRVVKGEPSPACQSERKREPAGGKGNNLARELHLHSRHFLVRQSSITMRSEK